MKAQWTGKAAVQAEGVFVRPLRKGRREAWVRVCAVPMDEKGNDRLGRYHGRTGVPLYAIEYADGTYSYFRTQALERDLVRAYPKAKVEVANVRELNKWIGSATSVLLDKPSR